VNDWKTIDSAPEDPEIWLGTSGRVVLGYRGMNGSWKSSWTGYALRWKPTHWMPFEMPSPPVSQTLPPCPWCGGKDGKHEAVCRSPPQPVTPANKTGDSA
jgi:hypothetical protein